MVVRRVRNSEWITRYRQALLERTTEFDIDNGFIPDIIINPTAEVLDNQNETINYLYALLTLDESVSLDIDDVAQFVSINDIIPSEGTRSTVELTLIRYTNPRNDLFIPRGHPFAALSNGSSSIYFVTTRDVTLPLANASNYFNSFRERYEIRVPAISVERGEETEVGPNTITSFVRPLSGFDEVTNATGSSPTVDADTVTSLIRRFRLSVIGQDRATPYGVSKYIRNNFPTVTQTLAVFGENNERADTEPGAHDQYIIGRIEQSQTDFFEYTGEVPLTMTVQPVISVSEVRSGSTIYSEGVDYQVLFDETFNRGSIRAQTAIQFTGRGASPAEGEIVTVSYIYDILVRDIQRAFENNPSLFYPGRDLLLKQSDEIDIVLSANLFISGGYDFNTVRDAVETVLINFFDSLTLGDPVELSDIQQVVRGIVGVDNFIINRLSRVGDASGQSDLQMEFFEYARLDPGNLILNQG